MKFKASFPFPREGKTKKVARVSQLQRSEIFVARGFNPGENAEK
jgi:hypothetical protein